MGDTRPLAAKETGFVVWLGDPACHEPRTAGAKAAQLSRLVATHNVPDAFCVTTEAFETFERQGAMPGAVAGAIADAYVALAARSGLRMGTECGAMVPVAVRSSATDEDGSRASFAGQHATHLNVRSTTDLLAAVEDVWRSAGREAALAYRHDHGMNDALVSVAVLVQVLANCDASGVAFSADPVTGSRDRIVISASWGMGESIVGGGINPDRWVVSEAGGTVLERALGDKAHMTITDATGTREVVTPKFLRDRASLTDDQVQEVARMALTLEAHLGYPVDVEFAQVAGTIVLLQCRPITTLEGLETPSGGAR